MAELRCVLDTNVLISALISPSGLPSRVLERAFRDNRLLTSADALDELDTRLRRPKFDRYLLPGAAARFVDLVASQAERVTVASAVTDCPDPDDNHVLALALDGRADVIVTGDKRHLLPLHPYRGVDVLTPAAFAARIGLR